MFMADQWVGGHWGTSGTTDKSKYGITWFQYKLENQDGESKTLTNWMLCNPNRTIVLHCNVYNRRRHQTIGCENDIFSHPSGPIKRLGLLVKILKFWKKKINRGLPLGKSAYKNTLSRLVY